MRPGITALSILERCVVPPLNSFVFKEVSPQDVLDIVRSLKPSLSVDVYDLSSNLIKQVIDCIVHPLTFCINNCLVRGIFPDVLKVSRVVPVYKKGPRDCPENYRPISLVPIFSKVFEAIMHQQFYSYLDRNNL